MDIWWKAGGIELGLFIMGVIVGAIISWIYNKIKKSK